MYIFISMYEYKATVIKVYDGDTITARVNLGFNITIEERFRLYNVNTPEIRGEERELGIISRDRLRELILDKEVTIKTFKDRKGKYGRYIADIFIESNDEVINVTNWLITEGLGEYREY